MRRSVAGLIVAAIIGAVCFYFLQHHVSLYDLRDAVTP